MTSFPTGRPSGGGTFEAALLPDSEKERLCRDLLNEFGAKNVKEGSSGELIHSCVLPFGGHKNGDANPSASLNYKKLTYKCLGCGSGGGLLWFIGVCRGLETDQARRWLENETGTGNVEQDLGALLRYFDAIYNPTKNYLAPIPEISVSVLRPWLGPVHPYLTEIRRIPEKTLIEYCVGHDESTERIVFPHFWNTKLVGWQTRRIWDDGSEKYKSSPDFPKDRTIYNFSQRRTRAVVVEGVMSVLSKHHIEDNIEAVFGASVTDRQARLLSIHREVVLFLDNDRAGWSATDRLAEALTPYSVVSVAANPWAADPADLTDEEYVKAVEGAEPYATWRWPQQLLSWESG
jgi:5S rRNA maturation endonuclease (ribonuclease M5)